MSTQYYHRTGLCNFCNRYDEQEIGQFSAGWQFLFRGVRGKIECLQDWKDRLKVGKIFDEYGVGLPVDEFWQLVEKARKEPRSHATSYPTGNWLDKEGNSFLG